VEYIEKLVALFKVPPGFFYTIPPSLETVFALFQMRELFRCEQEIIRHSDG
jgi:hypothetical protein